VITAVIIGGAALFGGSGTMIGSVVGVLLIGALQNILVLGGVSSFWQTIVIGLVIVAAVAFDTWLRRQSSHT
jgi:ribose transport system permease protein